MKIRTNAGDVELTAEMVCRGMVLQSDHWIQNAARDGVLTMSRADPARPECWEATVDESWCYPVNAQRFLGCDPAIASRADCERFGVHGDAAAHGFARLRDGGALDLRHVLMPVGAISQRRDEERIVLPLTPGTERLLLDGERFVGLHAIYASPEDVRRLCCGAERLSNEQYDPHLCTLAIGDHDEHEDIAHGVKWKTSVARVDAAVKTVSAFNANLRGSAALLAGPSCGRCGKVTEPSAIGPMMLRLPVGDRYADAPVCQACLAEVNKDVGAWTIREGKIERKTEWPGLDIVSGKALDRLALLYDEERRAGETCEDLRARLRGVHGRRSRKDTGNGFRVGGTYVVGVDPARPGTEATAFVSAAMRKAGESFAAVGEAAKRCAESAMPVPSRCPCDALGRGAPGLHTKDCKAVRREKEAALVALVAAVPEGLDPIGWRAAVLAVHEHHGRYADRLRGDLFAEWLAFVLREGLTAGEVDGYHGLGYLEGLDAYQRAITPAPKVDRVRATWKTRGPVLPCDNGEDE